MPSEATSTDDRAARALEVLAGPRAAFHSAVAEAIDAVTAVLDARASAPEERVARAGAELGAFAAGRIDVGAFAGLFSVDEALDPAAASALRAARETLREVAARGDEAFLVTVEAGAGLRDVVAAAYADLGRVFAAGRAIESIVEGRGPAVGGEAGIGPLAFSAWTAHERVLAPPLVVEVEGADLVAAGLVEFLDGAAKIVLVVVGEAPPAPLVRLVSPSVAVVQAVDPEALESLAAAPGPGMAALVPESSARFRHDPAVAGPMAARLTLEWLPEEKPRRRVGGATAFQQAEDLRLLAELASAGSGATPMAAPVEIEAAPALPADRLAAWLLSRADLAGLDTRNGSG